MEKLEQLYEGKAKKVYATDDPCICIVSYKDDATAFNGEKRGTIRGKGVINNRITNYLMKRLSAEAGIPTHYIEELSDTDTAVKRVTIIPLEVIVRNVIDIRGTGENGMFSADLYADVDDYSNCYKCKYLYHGTMRRYDTFTNFQFENQNNKMERVFLYAINSFSPAGRMLGMFSGLSIQPMMPASFKFVLSPDVMEENEELKETLRFSKEDIRTMKKMNMFIINQHL